MVTLANFAKTTLLELVSFNPKYLKITAKEVQFYLFWDFVFNYSFLYRLDIVLLILTGTELKFGRTPAIVSFFCVGFCFHGWH